MSKPGYQLLFAICAAGSVAILAWTANNQKPEVTAAVLQAVLSAGAIFGSVALSDQQRRKDRQNRAARQFRELSASAAHARMILKELGEQYDLQGVGRAWLKAQIQKLCRRVDSLNVDELPNVAYQAALDLGHAADGMLHILDDSDQEIWQKIVDTANGTLQSVQNDIDAALITLKKDDYWEDN
jgi:hypothetical protein